MGGTRELSGRRALVTGGSRGIGRAIALELGRAGADVVVNYAVDAAAADLVVAELRQVGRRALAVQADVGDPDRCADLARTAGDFLGTVDLLVANAGIGARSIGYPTIVEATRADLERMLAVNFWSAVHLAQLLAPSMRDAPRGDIVLVSSGATDSARPRMGGYTISKAALEALGHTLALEERPHGTRVNVVSPGLVDTDMGRGAMLQFMGTDDVEAVGRDAPFGEVCRPEDVARVVAFLCTEGARYVTNQVIRIDGGGR